MQTLVRPGNTQKHTQETWQSREYPDTQTQMDLKGRFGSVGVYQLSSEIQCKLTNVIQSFISLISIENQGKMELQELINDIPNDW